MGTGLAKARYTVRQGTALGRAGTVFLDRVGGDIWVGGQMADCIAGTVAFPAD